MFKKRLSKIPFHVDVSDNCSTMCRSKKSFVKGISEGQERKGRNGAWLTINAAESFQMILR